MANRRWSWRAWAAVVVLALVAVAIASVTTRNAQPPSACPDGEEAIADVGGVTLCSHGTDAVTALPDAAPPSEAATHAVACIANGHSGARVQAVFARPVGHADRFAALAPALERAAGDVDHLVDKSAAQTGGTRHVRWATTTRATAAGCALDIVRVVVPAAAVGDFGALVDSLVSQGFDRPDRKYLVWMDSGAAACSGIATHLSDDRPGQENYNNTSTGYGQVDLACLARHGWAETHELLHLLGAVQRSAPHVSPAGHCSDEYDLLCYDDDGGGSFRTVVSCPSHANDRRLDCHHDDYFSTDPAPRSYLATHWNAANSRFLEDEAPVVVPGPVVGPPPNDAFATAPVLSGYHGSTPGTLAGATLEEGEPVHGGGVAGSIWYKWRPQVDGPVSVDTRGSGGDTVLDVSTGADVTRLVRVGANDDARDLAPQSRVTFTAVAGTTYRIAVSGRGAAIDTLLQWGPPPTGATDVSPGARFEAAVGWAVAVRVMPGRPDHTWRPHATVTRSQAVATLWRMMGRPSPGEPVSLTFSDVGPAATYRPALRWAVDAGVVPAAASFRPSDPLSRADLAAWTWAALGRAAPSPTDWAQSHHVVPAGREGGLPVSRAKLALGLFALANDPSAWTAFGAEAPPTVVF